MLRYIVKYITIIVIIFQLIFFAFVEVQAAGATLSLNILAGKVGEIFQFSLQRIGSSQIDLYSITTTSSNQGTQVSFQVPFGNYYLTPISDDGWALDSFDCYAPPFSQGGVGYNPLLNNMVELNLPNVQSLIGCNYYYSAAANNPVLIVPGVLGTEMFSNTDLLWADISRMVNPLYSDSFMDPLSFDSELTPVSQFVQTGDIFRRQTAGFGSNQITLFDYSQALIEEFTSQNYQEENNLFTFPYDWRYGITGTYDNGLDNLDSLKQKIDLILLETGDQKVDVVAHSTGALLIKKYIFEHPSDHHLGKVIFVGSPNLGSPKAFKALINGDNFGILGLSDGEMKKIAQNMPVVYDLAPSPVYNSLIGDFLKFSDPTVSLIKPAEPLNYVTSIAHFKQQNLINNQALDNSNALHSSQFDNFDPRTAGVDVYNIIGCKSSTFSQFTEVKQQNGTSVYDFPKNTTGDGTVPLLSAQTIPANSDHIFFAQKADHGKMLSADGIRQKIVNILTGSNLDTGSKVLSRDQVQNNPSLCQIKGENIKIKSPVDIFATDANGNYIGLAEDGSIQNDIPGASLEIWGDHKYLFLPTDEGQVYSIKLKGTATGTATIIDESIDGDSTLGSKIFSNVPVSAFLRGSVNLGILATLSLDTNNDGNIDKVLQPSSEINSEQSIDTLPPISTSTLSGTIGQAGFYRSDVSISLKSADVVVPGREAETSGILSSEYVLDGGASVTYGTSTQVNVSGEGSHTISFFATDKAGNNETVKNVSFVIDKTAPELFMQFNVVQKDLQFNAVDNMSSSSLISLIDLDDKITAQDQAGNSTVLQLKDKNRKKSLKAEIKSLSYNGVAADISKTILYYDWKYDKNDKLQNLVQQVQSRRNFYVLAAYGSGKTVLAGKDLTGFFSQILSGIKLFKITTNKGDFAWSLSN